MGEAAASPARLGRYKITGTLGRGASGIVFEALDPSLQRAVAIKTLDPRQAEPGLADRFLREARAVARLAHPHIVAVYDTGTDDGTAYIVLELVRGTTLATRLQSGQPLALWEALRIASELLDALSYAHASGVVHRDVKPANVMLDEQGRVKLADFGVARLAGAPDSTMAGTVIGTPRFMAPEQLTGEPVGPQADVFAAGALIYRMLTGHDAFEGESLHQVAMAVMSSQPAPPSQRSDNQVPAVLDAPVLRAMAKSPGDRFANAAAFAIALQRAAGEVLADDVFVPLARTSPPLPQADSAASVHVGPPVPPETPGSEADGTVLAPSTSALLGSQPAAPADATLMLPPAGGATPVGAVQLVVMGHAESSDRGRVVPVVGDELVIGRERGCGLELYDAQCSRRHAVIRRSDGRLRVEDLGSVNGTWLDGRRLQPGQPAPLLIGAAIRIGETTIALARAGQLALPDLSGELLAGRYRVEGVLRSSPRSTVYVARVGQGGAAVALKLLAPDLADDAGYARRFERAARAAAKLQHPHICPLLDHGVVSLTIAGRPVETPYLCHTLLAGGDLSSRLGQLAEVPTPRLVRWLSQLGSALAHAHRRGVLHGDLKTTSVAFDEDDNAYLMDFAVAEPRADGAVLGTPAFVAPELWAGAPESAASDQFAFGVLAYLLLSGNRPFVGQEDARTRERNFRRGAPPLHEEARAAGRDDVPHALGAAVAQALAADPARRHDSLDAFVHALEQAAQRRRHGTGTSVFVSYRHEPSAGWAVLIARELADKHRISAFVDTQRMDAAIQFPAKLARAIENCSVFVCLLGDGTLDSRWVREEIRLAHRFGKPMVPIFQEAFSAPEGDQLDGAVEALLQYDGVHLLDRRNIHIDHTIADLARLVAGTVGPADPA